MGFVKQKLRSYGASGGDISTDRLYGLSGGILKDISHARSMSNMIKSDDGAIQKRPGYSIYQDDNAPASIGSVHVLYKYGGDVFYYLSDKNVRVVKNGVATDTAIPFDASNMKSVQLGNYMVFVGNGLIIADGYTGGVFYWYNNERGGTIGSIYVPTLYIANKPSGAGSAYEAVNLLNQRVAEQYIGDGSSTVFKTHLHGDYFEAYIKGKDGMWGMVPIKSHGSDYVEFETAPSPPSVAGEDNVRISYCYDGYGDAFRNISSCNVAATFGVGGMADRVFLSGSIANPGKVFYSHMDNPLYFADIDYIKVGDCETDVHTMNRRGNTLAVVADGLVYTVTGSAGQDAAIKQDALFVISNVYSTPNPVSFTDSYIFMDEPVYITNEGVCAITASGILDERCADIRSGTINDLLLKEDLKSLRMVTHRDLLIIYGGSRVYLLDGRKYKARGTERLYEGYVWDDIPAKNMWEYEDRLYFTDGTRIYRFNTGENRSDYRDERSIGEFYPINAYWETEYLYPSDFKDFKFFSRVGIRLDTSFNTNVRIKLKFDNEQSRFVSDYYGRFSRFDYGDMDYFNFVYAGERKTSIHTFRLMHKKGRRMVLRFENDIIGCPMKITAFGAEYMKM